MREGLLIALEGIDGSGTTSQGKRLADGLRAEGIAVHLTAEPSHGPVGSLIRDALEGRIDLSGPVLAMLFAADRLDHLDREVNPHIANGEIVLTDRYLLSSLAYQSVDNPHERVAVLNAEARLPDASILLRVSPDIAARRRAERGGREELFDALDRQRRVAAAYDRVCRLDDIGRTFVVDADRDFDTVATDLSRIVKGVLERR